MVREREGGEGGSGERIERKRTTNVVIGMKIGDGEHMNMYIHTYIHTYIRKLHSKVVTAVCRPALTICVSWLMWLKRYSKPLGMTPLSSWLNDSCSSGGPTTGGGA